MIYFMNVSYYLYSPCIRYTESDACSVYGDRTLVLGGLKSQIMDIVISVKVEINILNVKIRSSEKFHLFHEKKVKGLIKRTSYRARET